MENKPLKDCTDQEIHKYIDAALQDIRKSPKKCGDVIITLADGKVKFIDIRKPLCLQQ